MAVSKNKKNKTKSPHAPNGKRDPSLCKNPPWRPKKYETPEELQQHIDDYFQHCESTPIKIVKVFSQGSVETKVPTPPSMAGLAYWLDINRQSLNNWEKDNRFYSTVNRARLRIEQNNISMGQVGAYEPKINALNLSANFGYATKTELAATTTVELTDTETAARLASILSAAQLRKDKE